MTNSTFPTSYKDPVYAAADTAASDAAGIPQGLLQSVRTAGEKSNANQVSSAGATTPYQFTADTRARLKQKYGIDVTASPQAAALGAAYLLKEGIQRTGSAAGAVTQYIGGTDPANWGGQTRAYTNRVMSAFTGQGGQDTPQASPQPQAPAQLPSAASYGLDPSVVGLGGAPTQTPVAPVASQTPVAPGAGVNAQIVADYNAGRLSPSDMDAVDARVKSGNIQIDPSQLQRPQASQAAPQPKTIGPKTLAAIQAGTLAPQDLKTVQDGIANGTLVMPQAQSNGPQSGSQPQQPDNPPGGLQGSTATDANGVPLNQNPVTAAQNGSTLSDVAERGAGGVLGSLLDIASAGGRLVGATDFANQAHSARQQLDAKMAADTNGSMAGKVAGVVGGALPYVASGGATIPGAVAGGAVAGAVPSIAADKSTGTVARDAAFGAGAGFAGGVAGKYAGQAISALAENPTIAAGINKARQMFGGAPAKADSIAAAGGVADADTAAAIAAQSGNTPGGLASKLESAPAPNTPGYTPSAAELAGDSSVTALQKASTDMHPQVAANASADQDAAISAALKKGDAPDAGMPANPQATEQAAQAVANRADELKAQGQQELPPVSAQTAQALQTPQFDAPIKLARKMAADEGSDVFAIHDAAKQQAAADTLKQIIGTPEDLEAMKSARGAQAADDFLSANQGLPVSTPGLASILKRPSIVDAIGSANRAALDEGAQPIISGGNISGAGLQRIKSLIDQDLSQAAMSGASSDVRTLTKLKQDYLGVLDNAIPDYAAARDAYAKASGPIDAMQAVQSRLYSAVDPASGEVSPAKLINAINSIKGEQMKPGIRPADKVPQPTLDALAQLASHLQNKNDLTGLPAEGQEYLRRALASSDNHAAAHDQFKQVLNSGSPSYSELHGSHAQVASAVDSAVKSQYGLKQAEDLIDEARTPAELRSLNKLLPTMEAADQAKAIGLRQQKARDLAMAHVIDTNKNSRGGTSFDRKNFSVAVKNYGKYMNPDDASQFQAVSSDLDRQTTAYAKTGKIGGSDTTQRIGSVRRFANNLGSAFKDAAVQQMLYGASGMALGGPIGAAGGMAVGAISTALQRTISQKVSAISTENAAKLLSNGKMLAAALRNYESIAARREFIQGLSKKVGLTGGIAAGNAFTSRSTP
ncbi:hypothetical protein WM40_23815 [Robbsia andropogonis]|uniref:Transglycosylase SLT domain-containing protein n=1 Tax=Robbsia andropogonis TaxID=28092 RepID=A0A0F5JU07_9BURK|nr:hypothetical protein [Robbsia andropogonis]KKB61328.1 hypothetical protein WM40_23815 [Robbsia andropogonis]